MASDYWCNVAAPLLIELADELSQKQPSNPSEHLQRYLAAGSSDITSHGEPVDGLAEGDNEPAREDDDANRDTLGEQESMHRVRSSIVPEGLVPVEGGLNRFAYAMSPALLKGWVRQPAPGCAAATLAGVWNSMLPGKRADLEALGFQGGVEVLERVLQRAIDSRKARIEGAVGGNIDFLLEEACRRLREGVPIRSAKLATVQRVTKEAARDLARVEGDAVGVANSVINLLEGTFEEAEPDWQEGVAEVASSPHPREDLREMLRKVLGKEKLKADRPSTAHFGNWGFFSGAAELSQCTSTGISPRCTTILAKGLMGRRVGQPVSHEDDANRISSQWTLLWSWFCNENTALIYHMRCALHLFFSYVKRWCFSRY